MKNEKETNPVSELLHNILDTINTHELFQKDTLEVHLGRLDQVENNLLNVFEKMGVA